MPWIDVENTAYGAAVTLATNEDWQVRIGKVLVTTQAGAGDGGVLLDPDGVSVMQFNSGEQVFVRLAPFQTAARVWREPRP